MREEGDRRRRFDRAVQIAQLCLILLNTALVPIAFYGVKWVISVESRLAAIETKLEVKNIGNAIEH